MRKITCDRCGAEIPKGTPPGYICIQHEVDGTLVGDNPFEGWDFCEDCMKSIILAIVDNKIDIEVVEAPIKDPEEHAEQILEEVEQILVEVQQEEPPKAKDKKKKRRQLFQAPGAREGGPQ